MLSSGAWIFDGGGLTGGGSAGLGGKFGFDSSVGDGFCGDGDDDIALSRLGNRPARRAAPISQNLPLDLPIEIR